MLKVKAFAFNFFEENTYLVWDDATKEAVVIDPGMLLDDERETFDNEVYSLGLKAKTVLQTHLHLDHCFGTNHVVETYGAEVAAHPADAFLGETIGDQCARFGIRIPLQPVRITHPLAAGDQIAVGEHVIKVLHVPGHSPGGVAFYCEDMATVFSGDSLFRGGIGRTDLPGGSMSQLLQSIKSQLLTLPASTLVRSGHGPATTIAEEQRSNPYF